MNETEPGESQRQAKLDAALADYMERADRGEAIDRESFIAQHPDLAEDLRSYFRGSDEFERMVGAIPSTAEYGPPESLHDLGTLVRYFGDYELLEEIARGGMGIVYRARQISLNRLVALKMILAGQFATPA